jgi:hypothetical protein
MKSVKVRETSLEYIITKSSLRTEPCGTPQVTGRVEDSAPPDLTNCRRSPKNDLNRLLASSSSDTTAAHVRPYQKPVKNPEELIQLPAISLDLL